MKIAFIGLRWTTKGTGMSHSLEQVEINSRQNLTDYDMIVWDPIALLDHYLPERKRHNVMDEGSYRRMKSELGQHYEEMHELLRQGKMIVIFLPPPQNFVIETGMSRSNHRATNFDMLIEPDFKTIASEGKVISMRAESAALKTFFEATKDRMEYVAYFDKEIGRPFLFANNGKSVGSILKTERSHMLFLPRLVPGDNDPAGDVRRIVEALLKLGEELSQEAGGFVLPEWSNGYLLPGEAQQVKELGILEKEKLALEEKIEQKRQALHHWQQYKVLFAGGTGHTLQEKVIEALNDLGIEAQKGPEGRDDVILSLGDRPGVGEVKGVKKSAAEGDAAQLEKWVSSYYQQHKLEPKGILIVNPFRDVELKDRTEPAFPHQMLDYCIKRGHCLITTEQILQLVCLVKEQPEQKEKIASSIFSTVGVYDAFGSEREAYLQHEETTD